MIAKEALLAIRLLFQRCYGELMRHQFMEAAADQIGLTTDEWKQTLALFQMVQGRPVAAIEVCHLLTRKILQGQPGAHVERRLMQIGDEEMRFGGIGNGQRQPPPGTLWVECTLVV